MDYATWLSRLKAWIEQKQSVQGFALNELRCEEPADFDTVLNSLTTLGSKPPSELLEFYSSASSFCNIEYILRLPNTVGRFAIKGQESSTVPKTIYGGFQLVHFRKMAKLRDEMKSIAEFAIAHQPKNVAFDFDILRNIGSIYPMWRTCSGDFLVYASQCDGLDDGIFMADFGLILKKSGYVKYANSLAEWLEFLEKTHYFGPDSNILRFWNTQNSLTINVGLSRQFSQVFRKRSTPPDPE